MNTSEMLDKLIEHYSEYYEISYNVDVGGVIVPVVAGMRNREEKTLFGFGLKRKGPEAAEYVFVLKEDCFNSEVFLKVKGLIEAAEPQYVKLSRDHSFTFLSVAAVVESVDETALTQLKKYKLNKNYRDCGWMLARTAVFCGDGRSYSNKDGAPLEKMLKVKLK